jgi:hypothetical protein
MATDHRVSVSRRIAAPAAKIFALVSHPQGHVDLDGSGMLVAAVDAKPLEKVGDSFEMDMDREPLGDIPMGKYKVENIVTKIVPDSEIAWSVGTVGRSAFGHVYGYELVPIGEGATEVTSYCDWSGVPEQHQARFPIVPASMMTKSLENLDRIVTA